MKKILFKIAFLGILLTVGQSCQESIDPGDWDVKPVEFLDPNEYRGPSKTLKIMSFNMALRNDAHLFDAMVDVIKAYDPDLLFLRQVDSKTTRAKGVDRPQVIADELDMSVFFKKNFDYQGGGFGNAVLSKYPIEETVGLDLTKGTGGEQRSLAMIKVEVDEGVYLYFAGTELEGNETDRRSQAIDIINATQELEDPLVFVGNFNERQATPGPALTYFSGNFTFACQVTGCAFNAPKANPNGTYDYITFQDPNDLLIVEKNLEAFKNPETANTFFPTIAEIKIKLEK